jgi:hypothetical protein
MKLFINNCYGGFNFSYDACKLWLERKNISFIEDYKDYDGQPAFTIDGKRDYVSYSILRDNSDMIQIFEEKGSKFVSGHCSEIILVEIPDGCQYRIGEYDGIEHIDQIWIEVTLDELKNGLSQEQLDMVSKGCHVILKKS